MKTLEIEINYMGKEFTINELFMFLNNSKNVDISKHGGLVYLAKSFKDIIKDFGEFEDVLDDNEIELDNFKKSYFEEFYYDLDTFGIDNFLSSDYLYQREYLLPFLLMYIDFYKLENVDYDLFFNLINSEDEDDSHKNALIFAKKYFN